ncbi:MAG: DUF2848 domain-containing protein [Ramlibacter sp.]|nr:DUF2848 domain-containing protein [Ramlibacter sp.]
MNDRHELEFSFVSADGATRRAATVGQAIIAGWTSRDVAAMEHHIAELEAIGVPRPKRTPLYYRVGARRITTASRIEAAGGHSSGEVEFVVFHTQGQLWIGVGSDHTDRKVETYGITVSKQMCDKPVAPQLWPLSEVEAHWDRLELRSQVRIEGETSSYQEGSVTSMRHPRELIALYERDHGPFVEGSLMFCGTLAAIGGIRPAQRFEFALIDPVLDRQIGHGYEVATLPIAEES